MVRNHKLIVQAKWYRLAKALLKNSKESQLATIGNWRKLINGLRDQNALYDKKIKHLRICAKWRKLATILLSKEGKEGKESKEDKEHHLQVLGRWQTLVRTWQSSDTKQRKLRIHAKWRLLAVRALQKEKKLAQLKATGNWRKLYLALKRYEYDIYKERRKRKLEICAQWSKMARLMLQRHNKAAHLRAIGRWRVLY